MSDDEFKIKNFTTSVPAERSIGEIEHLLAKVGATSILKDYRGDARCYALSFRLNERAYKVPANVEGVQALLDCDRRKYSISKSEPIFPVAYRVAWRIILDWLHAQLSLIASGQAQPDEVLLPYMYDGKRTLYQAYKDDALRIEDKSELGRKVVVEQKEVVA